MTGEATRIGIDVGGTSIKGVRLDSTWRIEAELRAPTPSPDPTGQRVATVVAEIAARLQTSPPSPVGVVVPGVVDEERRRTVLSSNLGWGELPMALILEENIGSPVSFGHDVRAGALAERQIGAASTTDGVIAFVPIGTGIATAIIHGNTPISSGGWAGEIGQLPIYHGPHLGLPVEDVASAAAIARRADAPDARTVVRRMQMGDKTANQVWEEAIEALAQALTALTVVTAPNLIVLGGGLAQAGELLLTPLARSLREKIPHLRQPDLVVSGLGDRAAALGAALIASTSPRAT